MGRAWPCVIVLLASCDRVLGLGSITPAHDAGLPQCAMRSVGPGRLHTCAAIESGDVYCWGDNSHGESAPGGPPLSLAPTYVFLGQPAVQVGAGRGFSCARLEDGSVRCWGRNDEGELGNGAITAMGGASTVTLPGPAADLEVGAAQACAILAADRSIACWGSTSTASYFTLPGQPNPAIVPGTAGAKQLALGHRHACFVDAMDRVQCWGRNTQGELGVAPATRIDTPQLVPSLSGIAAVAVGGRTSCAVAQTGAVTCWGRGTNGELGDGTYDDTSVTPRSTGLADGTAIALATDGACVTRSDGSLACWGDIDEGAGAAEVRSTPGASSIANVTQIATHFYHQCAIANGYVMCWGADELGQLGHGSRALSPVPVAVPGLPATPSLVSADNDSVCAYAAGTLYCWGNNELAEVGDGSLTTRANATTITTGLPALAGLAGGYDHSCAWDANGNAECWGANSYGELGNGSMARALTSPTPSAFVDVAEIALGNHTACARLATGAVQCVGSNVHGQLGNGTSGNTTLTPVAVPGLSGIVQISVGLEHVCALDGNGAATCWADNANGQLGNNTTTEAHAPISVSLPSKVAEIRAGKNHTCARDITGAVYCWGDNGHGQLGQGDTIERHTPTKVTLPRAATALAIASGDDSCAVLADGSVMCWGFGALGNLGNNTTSDALSPVAIPALAGATLVSYGGTGGCAIVAGALMCWGESGSLANGDTSRSLPAVPVGLPCR